MVLFSLVSMVPLLIGLVLIAWAVVTICRAVMLPKGAKREPACEKCRYAVADLATFTCPECGSDLRTVGIVTPAIEATRRGSLTTAILAWTFLCGAGVYLVITIWIMFGSMSTAFGATGNSVTAWSQTLTPNSGAYDSVELTYDSDLLSIASEFDISVILVDGSEHLITLDPGPMKVAGLDAGVVDWDTDTIEVWFQEIGLDMTDSQIAAEAAETSRVVELTLMSPLSGYSLTLSHHTNQFVPTSGAMGTGLSSGNGIFGGLLWGVGGLALGLVVYVLGIVIIVCRRRGLLEQLAGERHTPQAVNINESQPRTPPPPPVAPPPSPT